MNKTTLIIFLAIVSNSLFAQDCLIADFPFNGNAIDETGNGNDGTINGAILVEDRFGTPNSAYYFDGIDDFISIPPDNFLLNEYTYSTWVSLSSIPSSSNYYCIMQIGNTGGTDQVMTMANDPNFSNIGASCGSWDDNGDPHSLSVEAIPNSEEWYHVVFIRDNTKAKMYLNGIAVDSLTISGVNAGYGSNPVATIGSRFSTMQFYHGKIDDVKIFRCVLTDSEVMDLHDNITGINTSLTNNPSYLKVYPNPALNWITIENYYPTHYKPIRLKLFNSFGHELYNFVLNDQFTEFDLKKEFESGLYFLQFTDSEGNLIETKKIIVN